MFIFSHIQKRKNINLQNTNPNKKSMAGKYNSMIIAFIMVMMIMTMEQANGETSAECRDRCSQSCAMTGTLPIKCLQTCYNRCHSLPSLAIGNYSFNIDFNLKTIRQKSFETKTKQM